ncbi:MAG: hypothetical protein OXI08_05970 [Cyanobacteria bacterium MAG IRC4_bin_6]|nr:hypothetical protein [Cyanobacteria bacterium MAG IRC4_bin_6]
MPAACGQVSGVCGAVGGNAGVQAWHGTSAPPAMFCAELLIERLLTEGGMHWQIPGVVG